MAKPLNSAIADVLRKYGFDQSAVWNCHGTWVVYHNALEQIAAKAEIKYAPPQILVAEKEAAAILVMGELNGKSEWSVGEAAVGVNYNVKGNQPAYPFAMAEKRAKDRVILKLIGLHGLAYSEEEADEFKDGRPSPEHKPDAPPPQPEDQRKAQETEWLSKRAKGPRLNDEDSAKTLQVMQEWVDICESLQDLNAYFKKNEDKINGLCDRDYIALKHTYVSKRASLPKLEDAA